MWVAVWLFTTHLVWAHGDIHGRISAISQRISAEPRNARLYVERANLLRQHENWTGALADYDKARQLDPGLDVDFPAGRVLLESGRPEESLFLLDGFLSRHPDHTAAMQQRARALTKLGRHDEAASAYLSALKHTSEPEPDLLLEVADALAAHGKPRQAVEVLVSGIGDLGFIPSLVLREAALLTELKDFDGAVTLVETMRQHSPHPEPWMARRASILAQAGRIRESITAWQSLADHLSALPAMERDSHAMIALMEETKQALASLGSFPEAAQPTTPH